MTMEEKLKIACALNAIDLLIVLKGKNELTHLAQKNLREVLNPALRQEVVEMAVAE